jgi:hypothetical protein
LDGLVALARGRGEQIPAIFDELLTRGVNVSFLGTPATLRLITALVQRKEHLSHCRQYLRMIQKHEPSGGVAKMLADVEAAMVTRLDQKKKQRKVATRRTEKRPPKKDGPRARGSGSRRSR